MYFYSYAIKASRDRLVWGQKPQISSLILLWKPVNTTLCALESDYTALEIHVEAKNNENEKYRFVSAVSEEYEAC